MRRGWRNREAPRKDWWTAGDSNPRPSRLSPGRSPQQGEKELVDGRGLEPPAFPVVTGTLSAGRSEGIGGRQGTRTPGLLVANEALSQLS